MLQGVAYVTDRPIDNCQDPSQQYPINETKETAT